MWPYSEPERLGLPSDYLIKPSPNTESQVLLS